MRTNRFVHVFKNKKGMRVIRIEMGVFDIWVLTIIGPSKCIQPFVRWNYNKPNFIHDPGEYGGQRGLCLKPNGCAPCIWIPRKPKTPDEMGTLVHECTHAALYVADWVGEKVGPNQSELLAHTAGWLFQNIMEHA
jgi:hypothetical protein